MEFKPVNPRITLADGVTLSVQAGAYAYSTPRRDKGPYKAVEVGYIQNAKGKNLPPPEGWREYGDGKFPTNVYAYVPVELVKALIEAHGGIVKGKLP